MNHSKLPPLLDLGLLLALWLAAVCLLLRTLAADGQSLVTFNLAQFTGATNDTTLTLLARDNPVIYHGQFYWQPAGGLALATTNGQAATWLVPGQYTVALAGVPQAWTITVTNSAAPLNAASLTTGTVIYNGINRLSGPGVTNDGAGDYFVPVLTNPLAASVLTGAVALAAAGLYVSNQVVYVSTNADAYGAAFAATNALAGTGAFVAAAALVTNNQTSVTFGALAANGAGLTNLPGYAISGAVVPQNPLALSYQSYTAQQPNGPFANPNWVGWVNTLGVNSFTNVPQVALYCGYPVNSLAFGYLPAITGYTLPSQSGELRVATTILGRQFGFFILDWNFWYRTDGSQWNYYYLPGDGQPGYLTLTWPNFGRHKIELQVTGDLLDLYVPATNSFVNTPQPTQTGIIVGDSITDGAGGVSGENLWPAQLEDLLEPYGINLISQSEGGTGYVNNGPGSNGSTNFLARLTNAVAAFNPAFVIWAGGINDATNNLYSAETNCYGVLKTLLPNCKQLVIAPWGSMVQGAEAPSDQITSNAAAACHLPVIYPEFSAKTAWVTGIYNVLGSGTAPIYWSGNGPHPNALGHQFYAGQVASFVLTNLLPNATPILW